MKNNEPQPLSTDSTTSEILLAMIGKLGADLHPSKAANLQPKLNSSLQNDLGIDSIGRAEIALRVEQIFGVSLSDEVIATAETAEDILKAIHASKDAGHARDTINQRMQNRVFLRPPENTHLPLAAKTLIDVVRWNAEKNPHQTYIEFLRPDREEVDKLTFQQLYERSSLYASALMARGLHFAEPVAIMLPTCLEFFYSFYGILFAGGIPVPLYPPDRPSQLEDSLKRQTTILRNCEARFLISAKDNSKLSTYIKTVFKNIIEVIYTEDLEKASKTMAFPEVGSDDIAFLQYTSGSTGDPKGVILTHANLLANIRTIGAFIGIKPNDVFVSWLPLYHDMGLIGAVLGSLYFANSLVLMSPMTFLARPARWLWAIHKYRGTLAAAPNFAYELCAARISDSELDGIDLSSWRFALNGSESVRSETINNFVNRFSRYGFRAEAFCPAYGLAESSVGLAFSELSRIAKIDTVDKKILGIQGRALAPTSDDRATSAFVSCGKALPGHRIRIADDQDHTVGEGIVGHVQFLGPSCTTGYYKNPQATQKLFHENNDPGYLGRWLDSGDLGYFKDGELFITGRQKDMMIRGGEHFFPEELEEQLGNIPGVRKGCVVVFASSDAKLGTERIVVVAESRTKDQVEQATLRNRLEKSANKILGIAVDEVKIVSPRSIPKTPSGKLRRASCRELYENGKLGVVVPLWKQWLSLRKTTLYAQINSTSKKAFQFIFSIYAWSWVLILVFPWLLSILFLPTIELRMRCSRYLGRFLFAALFIPLEVRGKEKLAGRGERIIYVANHTSYLDAIAVAVAVPRPLVFVAKREFEGHWLMGPLLKRLGCVFVERYVAKDAMQDLKVVEKAMANNPALFVFAEGGFTFESGLKPFRMGAFQLAAQTRTPIIAVALKGNREIFPADHWDPRHGRITITISDKFFAKGTDWESLLDLRNQVRKEILKYCGEAEIPD